MTSDKERRSPIRQIGSAAISAIAPVGNKKSGPRPGPALKQSSHQGKEQLGKTNARETSGIREISNGGAADPLNNRRVIKMRDAAVNGDAHACWRVHRGVCADDCVSVLRAVICLAASVKIWPSPNCTVGMHCGAQE